MAPKKETGKGSRIPINFSDEEEDGEILNGSYSDEFASEAEDQNARSEEEIDSEMDPDVIDEQIGIDDLPPEIFDDIPDASAPSSEAGGPLFAELVATRSELKRVEGEIAELKDRLARRQADFENYRKRGERERGETYDRVVVEIAAKLLPVLDNLKRALDTEASLEAGESDEFRHFLSGVDLIFKQLGGVIEALGVKPVLAIGERFDPHIHEAVVTEPSDDHEPDTVMEEIIRGYRLGDKLIRPALVKVATKK
ncbi:MAG: nucleotide exchange factor GrpE [bacterium]